MAPLIARLVASQERHVQLARENGALYERLAGLEHQLRRLRGTPASDAGVPEFAAAAPGASATTPERPPGAADPRKAPRGFAPGHPPASVAAADTDAPAPTALVGPVLTPAMAGLYARQWPGEGRAGGLGDQPERVVHLWVLVTAQGLGGRRRRPASSPPAGPIGGSQRTTVGSLALSLIAVITAWSIMAAWWALR